MSCQKTANRVATSSAKKGGLPVTAGKSANASGQATATLQPRVRAETETRRTGRYCVEPLAPGYGVTLGNALRRTLLAAIPGAAVTSVTVAGLKHEFSTIPGVREDMTALILNLKGVRLRFSRNKPASLALTVRGEGQVTAGDIDCPPHVKVVNPKHVLLTGDSAKTKVDIALRAETGSGYSPSEERRGLPIGNVPIDAIFSPIRKANFRVERAGVVDTARTGQPFDKLIVEVETDGTLKPETALRQASKMLAGQFTHLAEGPWLRGQAEPDFLYHRSLDGLGLEPRTKNALHRAGLKTVNGILIRLRQNPRDVQALKGLGRKSYADLLNQLARQPLSDGDRTLIELLRKKR